MLMTKSTNMMSREGSITSLLVASLYLNIKSSKRRSKGGEGEEKLFWVAMQGSVTNVKLAFYHYHLEISCETCLLTYVSTTILLL